MAREFVLQALDVTATDLSPMKITISKRLIVSVNRMKPLGDFDHIARVPLDPHFLFLFVQVSYICFFFFFI